MLVGFLQTHTFRANWQRLGLTDDDLRALENELRADPARYPVMRGTGGLRKIRIAPDASVGGKSGGCRVCYAYFASYGLVYLFAAFAKSARSNLTVAERNEYRKLLTATEQYLRRHWHEGWTP